MERMTKVDENIQTAQNMLSGIVERCYELEEENKKLKKKIELLDNENMCLNAEIKDREEENKKLNIKVASLEGEIKGLNHTIERLHKEIEELEKPHPKFSDFGGYDLDQ